MFDSYIFEKGGLQFEHTGTKGMYDLPPCFHMIQDEIRQIFRV